MNTGKAKHLRDKLSKQTKFPYMYLGPSEAHVKCEWPLVKSGGRKIPEDGPTEQAVPPPSLTSPVHLHRARGRRLPKDRNLS